MPDWKKAELYPEVESLHAAAWAWEFLRRNPEYRLDYKKVQSALAKAKAKAPPPAASWLAHPEDPQADPETNVYHPPLEPSESLGAWRLRCIDSGHDPKEYPLELWYARKWRLQRELVDPNQPYTDSVCFEACPHPRLFKWEDQDMYFGPDEFNFSPYAPYVVIAFDVMQSIPAQTDLAGKLLSTVRDEMKEQGLLSAKEGKSWKHNWPTYLRVLDAVDECATAKEIADALFPHKNEESGPQQEGTKHASDLIKQAQKVCRSGYIQILGT